MANREIKKIGVLTSGGDAPGMNACIRSVVRTAVSKDIDVYGIRKGYQGLIEGDLIPMSARDVSGFARMGGTYLGSARCLAFKEEEGMNRAIDVIKGYELDGIVVIGGDGSLRGAMDLHTRGINVMGIPASIDNDIAYTDYSIGVDTALNTILDAMDKIRDTAAAHHRGFVVEVMGNKNGYLALASGIAGGAELIIVPNSVIDKEAIIHSIKSCFLRKKPNFICIVAEGASTPEYNITDLMSQYIEEAGFECRKTVLGHVQRGGTPSAFDRVLSTRFGVTAVELLIKGRTGEMVGLYGNKIISTPIEKVVAATKELKLPLDITDIVDMLTV